MSITTKFSNSKVLRSGKIKSRNKKIKLGMISETPKEEIINEQPEPKIEWFVYFFYVLSLLVVGLVVYLNLKS